MKIINVKMDEELHRKFKAKVSDDGNDMQHKILELIQEYLGEEVNKTLHYK